MTIVDLNLLLYAVNRDAPDHSRARKWWEARLRDSTPVGLTWSVLLGFLRLTSHPRVMPRPLSTADAVAVVDGWLECATVRVVMPTERHWGILRRLLTPLGMAGNLTADAHLAAIAIEHGAELCSADSDFGRFPELRWTNPLL